VDNFVGTPDFASFDKYTTGGYSLLQNWMANFILRTRFPDEVDERIPTISHLLIPMSSNEYDTDPFDQIL
jgi:ATP-binding cassette subfamily A (ABC1) protein 3